LCLPVCSRPRTTEHRLYVADKTSVSIYDIDHGQKLLRTIAMPDSGNFKGIAANMRYGTQYLTSANEGELICIDLKSSRTAPGVNIRPDQKEVCVADGFTSRG
jgi:hypothetical protein